MRYFFAILLAVLGIGAIASVLLAFGSQATFWQAAHIIGGLVLILGGVTLARKPDTVAPQDILDEDEYIGL